MTADLAMTGTVCEAALLDADVRLRAGEIAAVLGPQWCRQDDAAARRRRLLATRPAQLRTRVLDDPGGADAFPSRERGIRLVFQDYRLFPRMSVRDNVAFGRAMAAPAASTPLPRRIADHWLDRMALGLASRRPADISRGQGATGRPSRPSPPARRPPARQAARRISTRRRGRPSGASCAHLADSPVVAVVTHDPAGGARPRRPPPRPRRRGSRSGGCASTSPGDRGRRVARAVRLNFYRSGSRSPGRVRSTAARSSTRACDDVTAWSSSPSGPARSRSTPRNRAGRRRGMCGGAPYGLSICSATGSSSTSTALRPPASTSRRRRSPTSAWCQVAQCG